MELSRSRWQKPQTLLHLDQIKHRNAQSFHSCSSYHPIIESIFQLNISRLCLSGKPRELTYFTLFDVHFERHFMIDLCIYIDHYRGCRHFDCSSLILSIRVSEYQSIKFRSSDGCPQSTAPSHIREHLSNKEAMFAKKQVETKFKKFP